mmetsp:Transcript_17392/g.50587  ORF Transcript_17392/g.50587 Transcript_17392/m.50587 type:complete len:229 (+) Transcript_17392:1200-1886(+)
MGRGSGRRTGRPRRPWQRRTLSLLLPPSNGAPPLTRSLILSQALPNLRPRPRPRTTPSKLSPSSPLLPPWNAPSTPKATSAAPTRTRPSMLTAAFAKIPPTSLNLPPMRFRDPLKPVPALLESGGRGPWPLRRAGELIHCYPLRNCGGRLKISRRSTKRSTPGRWIWTARTRWGMARCARPLRTRTPLLSPVLWHRPRSKMMPASKTEAMVATTTRKERLRATWSQQA